MDCSPNWPRPFARAGDEWRQSAMDLRFSPISVEGGWPLRMRGMLKHMFYLKLGNAWG
jgi:hypothetical protein